MLKVGGGLTVGSSSGGCSSRKNPIPVINSPFRKNFGSPNYRISTSKKPQCNDTASKIKRGVADSARTDAYKIRNSVKKGNLKETTDKKENGSSDSSEPNDSADSGSGSDSRDSPSSITSSHGHFQLDNGLFI